MVTYGFGVERFEPSDQNADHNDGGDFSRYGSWDDFDELTYIAGSGGKSYKRETRPLERGFESNVMMGKTGMRNRELAGSMRSPSGCLCRAVSSAAKGAAMRGFGHSLTLVTVLGFMSGPAMGQGGSTDATRAKLLEFRPSQAGVEYDTPADEATRKACKVEPVVNAENRNIGVALRDPQGKMLRRFVTARGKRMDQWSYYQDGFEVYREDDLDGDNHLDECRWLNSGGSRIALVEGGKVKGWKQISAEEASKVLVQALVAGDASLLETVMASAAELSESGVPKDVVAKVATAAEKRLEQLAALRKQLIGWNAQTIWNRFDGTFPHVIPADPAVGLAKDVMLYENAMVIPGTTAAQQNAAKMAFLQVPDMIQLGSTWKFIELPHAIDPEKPIVAAASSLRSMLFDRAGNVEPRDEEMELALKALADYDAKNAPLLQNGDKKGIARYHVNRIPFLRELVKKSKNPDEKVSYNKQVVDSLISALRTGLYPEGRKPLEAIIKEGDRLASYAAYSLIDADFAMKNDEDGANFVANQKKWMAELEKFLERFSETEEAAPVLFHLANANEFNADEAKAHEQYERLVKDYSATEAGKKAAGALKRLDLAGKPLTIAGTGLDSETVDSSKYRGKPVLIVFWASWATPVKQDLPELVKLYDKHKKDGLEIIGVNLDNDRAELAAFVKEHRIAWPQIFEAGGMESRLAVDYGIILLPSMFLVDSEGKVVNRNLRTSGEVDRQLSKMLANKPAGVAVDRKEIK
jgi:thiol-disulfide isomerase/thioredoxin